MTTADDWRGDLGARWAARAEIQDRALAGFGAEALATLSTAVGDHGLEGLPVLDLGCGAGATTCALARRGAAAVGVDISPDLVALAAARSAEAGPMAGTTRFVEADASVAPPPGPFGALFSRFGCMFFDPAPAAWTRLRAGMRHGAPLVCVAWQAARDNEWVRAPLAACADLLEDLPSPPKAAPGAPGPFGWAEPERVSAWLTEAGWRSIAWRDIERPMSMAARDAEDPAGDATAFLMRNGPIAARFAEADAARTEAISARLRAMFEGRATPLNGAARIFTAVA